MEHTLTTVKGMINLGNSVDLFSKDNTEPSRRSDFAEGVTTIAEVSGETEAGRLDESPFVAPGSLKIAD